MDRRISTRIKIGGVYGKKQKEKTNNITECKAFLIVLLIPIALTVYIFAYFSWQQIRELPFMEQFAEKSVYQQIQEQFDLAIPIEYIPIM